MTLRTALANIHRDPFWWRKILIGGALMLTVVGWPWAAGLVMESMENTRRGFPAPLPPWREWSTRYVIGLFAVLIDILFFGLPVFAAGLLFLCVGTLLIASAADGSAWLPAAALLALGLYELLAFLSSVSPVGRLLYVEAGRAEEALGGRAVREALRPPARGIYARARLRSLPAYLPFVLLALASWLAPWPFALALAWLALSALLYAHLAVAQLYVAAESDVRFGGWAET
jgi:hypothetical protein